MFAAIKTCDDNVWLPSCLDSDTAIHARQDETFTMPADQPPIFSGKPYFSCHSNPSRNFDVTLRLQRISVNNLFGEFKKGTNAL